MKSPVRALALVVWAVLTVPALACDGPAQHSCDYMGKSYAEGAQFSSSEGCSCVCTAKGVGCTTGNCGDAGTADTAGGDGP